MKAESPFAEVVKMYGKSKGKWMEEGKVEIHRGWEAQVRDLYSGISLNVKKRRCCILCRM